MDVHLVEAAPEHATTLENLFQLYTYDLSETMGWDVDDQGRFAPRSFAVYWTESFRHPFLIRRGEHLAGFALVHHKSRLTGDLATWDVAEFFVLRRHRRHGVGERAATLLFDRFRGRWEVRQLDQNTAATAFWRRVIHRYTGGRFDAVRWDDDQWHGPVQRFDNTAGS